LIELLLALGLSLIILVAVYGALDQHWRYASAGQRQTERIQVIRALFERMSLDVRSVVFRPFATRDDATALRDATRTGGSVGIIGDSETLVVQINRPEARGAIQTGTVRWEMQALAANDRDQTQAFKSRPAADSTNEQSLSGLARMTGDAASVGSLSDVKASSTEDLLAPEVERIRFRYFSRGSWFDDWNSRDRQELPQAVEITIDFRRTNPAEQETSGEASGKYRLVVPVPASEG
jgi:type II secretory pathway component PulJ